MSKMRSSTMVARMPPSGSRSLRLSSTGRMTSPMRKGRTMFAMNPMLVAATRVRMAGVPTGRNSTRHRCARMYRLHTLTTNIGSTYT